MTSNGGISAVTWAALAAVLALLCATAPLTAAEHGREPFGLVGYDAPDGPLPTRWRALEQRIGAERQVLAACRAQPVSCGSPAAARFLAIIDDARAQVGRAKLGAVNRGVNLAIRWSDDLVQHGAPELWTAPLATFAAGRGDCMDYAVAKYVALEEAGLPQADLRIVIGWNTVAKELHGLLAARSEERWFILDNRSLVILEDAELKSYLPLFAINADGVKRLEPPRRDDAKPTDKVADTRACAADG